MDEPLSNLDAKLRMEMRTELKRLHRDTDSTFVYVTHDQLEAMTLTMNFIDGTANVSGSEALLSFGGLKGKFTAGSPIALTGRDVVVGVRPEYIHISDEGSRVGTVYSTLPAGMETTVKLDVAGTMLTAVVFGDVDYPVDSQVRFDFSKNAILFDKATGKNVANGKIAMA